MTYDKVKVLFATLVLFGGVFGVAPTATALPGTHPAFADFQSDACNGIESVGSNGCKNSGSAIPKLMSTLLNILSFFAGFVAVVMIMIGGFQFVTANGDSGKITSARMTIIYALVGLVVVLMSQAIVHFVLAKVGGK